MVVTVLTSWHGVKIQVDTETVFAGPGKSLEEVSPSNIREERLIIPLLDDPVRYRHANPVQSSSGDFGKVFLGLYEQREPKSACMRRLELMATHDKRLVVLSHGASQVGP